MFFDYSLDSCVSSFLSTSKTFLKCSELEDALRVDIDVPGVKKTDIKISQNEQVLTVKGNRDKRDFLRRIVIRDDYDPSTVKASLEDGVLSLIVKKRSAKLCREIPIT